MGNCYSVCIVYVLLNVLSIVNTPAFASDTTGMAYLEKTVENPFSTMHVQRRIGAALTGAGAAAIGVGILFKSNPTWDSQAEESSLLTPRIPYGTLFLIVGIGYCGAGLPLYICSRVNNAKHDKWNKENSSVKLSLEGSRVTINYFF